MEERNEMENVDIVGSKVETLGPIVATAETGVLDMEAVADLDRRIQTLEAAMEELRALRASTPGGRKTLVADALHAKGGVVAETANVDDALRSLSVEQRIAVKSGLIRAGLLT